MPKYVIRRKKPDCGKDEYLKPNWKWTSEINDAAIFDTKSEATERLEDNQDVIIAYISDKNWVTVKKEEVAKWYIPDFLWVVLSKNVFGEENIYGTFTDLQLAISAVEKIIERENTHYIKFIRVTGSETGDISRMYSDKWGCSIMIRKFSTNKSYA